MLQRAIWLATAAMVLLPAPAFAQPAKPAPHAKPAAGAAVGEVVVEGVAPPVRSSIDRKSYSVTGDLQATTGSIGDALRNVPSVEVDVQGNVALRGDGNVTIMIDGKPSGMFRGENKGQALQSLPANQIDRVEVITNPSAAFNPEGSGGIINLVTRKTAKPGVNGSVRANVGSAGRQNGGLNASYRNGRLTVTGDLYGRHDSTAQRFTSARTFFDASGAEVMADSRDQRGSGDVIVQSARLGADYDLDDGNRISLAVDYTGVRFDTGAIDAFERTGSGGVPLLAYDTFNQLRQDRNNLETELSFRRKFGDDHEFNVSLFRELTDEDRDRAQLRSLRLPMGPSPYELTQYRNHGWSTLLKVDYARPLPGEQKLKLGYEFDTDDNDYDLVFSRALGANPLAVDATRSNLFKLDQQVHAVFGTYERPIGKLTALAGLRVEATLIDLNQVTQGLKSDNDYVRAYPSLHLSYRLDEVQQFSASYSRRVQRPQPQDYNAFVTYLDPFNRSQGNPDLKPQQTDSFELGYQYRKSGAVYLGTLYYRRGQDAVNDIFRDIGGGVVLQTKVNVGSFQTAGLELVANGRLPGGFSYNLSGNLLWSEIDSTDLGFGGGERAAYTASGRGSLNWQVTSRDFLQLQGYLNGRRLLSQGYQSPTAVMNLGYRHKFRDDLSAVITVQDVFATARFGSLVDTPFYREANRGKPKNRGVFMGVTYTFGGGKARDTFDFGGGTPGG